MQELALAVDVLKARDARRTREIKSLRGDLDAIERMIAKQDLPPTGATESSSHSMGARGATVAERLRLFFRGARG